MAPAAGQDELRAAVVVRDFDVRALATGALRFTLGVSRPLQEAWLAQFTRTIFLVGAPANLGRRFSFAYVGADDGLGWVGPGPAGELEPLTRLLRLFRAGPAADHLPSAVEVDPVDASAATGSVRRLEVAIGGLSLEAYAVHVHHALCECAITGTIEPGDRLSIVHRERLGAPPATCDYVRVRPDASRPGRPRTYAILTTLAGQLAS